MWGTALSVIGTLLGTALGASVTLWTEKVRWRRAESTRWFDERRRVYAEFLHVATDLLEAARLAPLAYQAALRDPERAAERDEALTAFAAARDDAWRVVREIELVGEQATLDAAKRVPRAAVDVSAVENQLIQNPTEEALAAQSRAYRAVGEALDAFREAARQEIGLPKLDNLRK